MAKSQVATLAKQLEAELKKSKGELTEAECDSLTDLVQCMDEYDLIGEEEESEDEDEEEEDDSEEDEEDEEDEGEIEED